MARKLIECCRCGLDKPAAKGEPDFCQECDDAIEANCLMPRVEAAVAYINSVPDSKRRDELEVYAFLSLFHPEMTHARKRELCSHD